MSREESRALQERLQTAEELLRDAQSRLDAVTEQCQQAVDQTGALQADLAR